MAVNLLKRAQKGLTNHALEFAKQTALGGPKYFVNRGTIKGGTDVKPGKVILLKISRFDKLVAIRCTYTLSVLMRVFVIQSTTFYPMIPDKSSNASAK